MPLIPKTNFISIGIKQVPKAVFDKDHSVITFATNKLSYLHFAFNCARSVLLHNDINIYIVTNIEAPVPADLKGKVILIEPDPEHAAMGICVKLFTIDYVQTLHTLFIDADCLCYGDLSPIFEMAKPMHVTVAGNITPAAEWVGNNFANEIKEFFGLEKLTRFNGGFYYIKKSETSKSIFTKAEAITNEHDFGYNNDRTRLVNEEFQMSIAMLLHNQQPLPDNGTIITDFATDRRPRPLNILKQQRILKNPEPPARLHRTWYPSKYSPVILHFGGSNLNSYPYISQTMLLKLYRFGVPVLLSTLFVNVFIDLPYRTWHWLRKSV